MKSSVPKGDKKKKKDVMAEIALMISNVDLKHAEETEKFKAQQLSAMTEANGDNFATQCSSTQHDNNEIDNCGIEVSDNVVCEDAKPTQRVTRAQKRRNKKAEKVKARESLLSEAELENVKGARFLEAEDISNKLSQMHLVLHEIPSDGNCLFKAIEHQLSIHDFEKKSAEDLRKLTANFLVEHKEDYQPFLINPRTDKMYTDDQYIAYCESLKDPSVWGGHVEVQALANICGRPIEIVQANGPNVISGENLTGPKLTISYHRFQFGLGAHYNSTVPF